MVSDTSWVLSHRCHHDLLYRLPTGARIVTPLRNRGAEVSEGGSGGFFKSRLQSPRQRRSAAGRSPSRGRDRGPTTTSARGRSHSNCRSSFTGRGPSRPSSRRRPAVDPAGQGTSPEDRLTIMTATPGCSGELQVGVPWSRKSRRGLQQLEHASCSCGPRHAPDRPISRGCLAPLRCCRLPPPNAARGRPRGDRPS
jgi:hypothetical protein